MYENSRFTSLEFLSFLRNGKKNIIFGVGELVKRIKKNILHLDGVCGIYALYKKYYIDYLKSKNIDISQNVINISGMQIINPIFYEESFLNDFLFELGDLILPEFFGDYSQINEGEYENDYVKISRNDIVLDCGANIGLFSAIAATKNAKVYAFEPTPKTIEVLNETVNLYNGKIEICKYALSDYVGKARFYISDENVSNSLYERHIDTKEYIDVDVTTVDEFVKSNNIKRVDFIKADIEGAERYMLRGAEKTLKKYAPKLSICTYHLKDDPEVLEEIIRKANPEYTIIKKRKKIYAFVDKK